MTPLFEARGISKAFGQSIVLNDVSLRVASGEIVSVIGENGAGKSTLAKIIAGIHRPESGSLMFSGQEVAFPSPAAALQAGIALVHQELNLADNLTVIQNIMLGREETRYGFLTRGMRTTEAEKILREFAPSINPHTVVSQLSSAEKQLVEICRALFFKPKLLLFDEPTSSLSEREGDRLLTTIESLRKIGVSILYVSHRLAEVLRISDRVLALRDGSLSGEAQRTELSRELLVQMMIGRELRELYPYQPRDLGNCVMSVRNLRASAAHQLVTLSIRAGEIVAISGLIGSGRSEILEALFGLGANSATIVVNGREMIVDSPEKAIRAGVALLPENRKDQGLFLEGTIEDNLSTAALPRSKGLFRRPEREAAHARQLIRQLSIRCRNEKQFTKELSGGNQQKVVLAKCLTASPSLLLLDEPTRGVDIGARREIYSILFELARNGTAILLVSSELEEIIGIADRAIVIAHGAVQGELQRAEFSEHAFMTLASAQPASAA